jgi:plasmid stabilization system protein ParE
MPQSAWSAKRERQYEHIKDSEKKEGRSTKRAKEIAARTVNKERARAGETRGGASKEQLYNEAKRRNIPGRSQMTKTQLQRAVDARK